MNNNFWLIDQEIFKHPFTCTIAGPTQSGKTWLKKKILQFNNVIFDNPPLNIIYCYSTWEKSFEKFRDILPKVAFKQGLPDIDEIDPSQNNLIILDDLMKECEEDFSIQKLFTIESHHKNISVFFITQNIFSKGKFTRTLNLNSHYLVLFNNPRDKLQISTLARQMFPGKSSFFIESYEDASLKPHGYLMIDLKQTTENRNRIQTGITPDEKRIIYTPK
ncbi:unnamed protein product [Brachionus calyciflorus]|uniref:Uncharacterized protein n=1 Tax=Brachionus calyciflorus TaxID=104777 RepID=A0A814NMI1_9BILA|nr:unnamed protein product [Brachionus calyciflorus]